jgi:molybdate transport system permease protein
MMLNEHDMIALAISVKLAAITVLLLLLVGTPLAWWLARTRWRFKFLLEAVFALPLVLPPTVLGFYLLVVLGPQGAVGKAAVAMGGQPLAFTFTGLVLGSMVYSLPFVVQPLQAAFSALGKRPIEVAAT